MADTCDDVNGEGDKLLVMEGDVEALEEAETAEKLALGDGNTDEDAVAELLMDAVSDALTVKEADTDVDDVGVVLILLVRVMDEVGVTVMVGGITMSAGGMAGTV